MMLQRKKKCQLPVKCCMNSDVFYLGFFMCAFPDSVGCQGIGKDSRHLRLSETNEKVLKCLITVSCVRVIIVNRCGLE